MSDQRLKATLELISRATRLAGFSNEAFNASEEEHGGDPDAEEWARVVLQWFDEASVLGDATQGDADRFLKVARDSFGNSADNAYDSLKMGGLDEEEEQDYRDVLAWYEDVETLLADSN